MKKTVASIVALALLAAGSTYSVSDTGTWPKEWPSRLEPLRSQSRTFVVPTTDVQFFAIRFKTREEFESAWPHIVNVKSKGAPIFLVRGPNFFLGKEQAGVVIHRAPDRQWENPETAEAPMQGYANESRSRSQWINDIELVVDGRIIDLNRIPLPSDTPIIDGRFKLDEQGGGTKSR